MKVSAKTEYACLAMLELAARWGQPDPVPIREIARAHHVPSRFLVQILLQLKGAGLVASTRGASGGYQLLRPPQEISLGEVMAVIDGPIEQGLAGGSGDQSPAGRVLMRTWRELARLETEYLSQLSLAQLVERMRKSEPMYYI